MISSLEEKTKQKKTRVKSIVFLIRPSALSGDCASSYKESFQQSYGSLRVLGTGMRSPAFEAEDLTLKVKQA
jgi:hypothetical protein